jgi:predicted RNA binding protein YcfA (HicA-like mRNA interferase family)|nr:MAG TPA: putative RNA-binding protein [Crassvirales sp.]
MRQYTSREFIKIVEFNGFYYDRHNGDHAIYVNDKGRHISIPKNLECVIARRLIKENNLITDIKRKKKKIMDNYNYPMGADTKDAPWNQVDNPEREIEVTVSVTLSKTVKIKVSDYEITDSGKDEDGEYFEDIDYSKCDLKRAVEEQITLPQDAYKYVKGEFNNDQRNDLEGWDVDDFEVIEE